MARSSTTWKPGQSGNLKGRPPKERALAHLLQQAGEKLTEDGRPNKAVMAEQIWEALTKGYVEFLDGSGTRRLNLNTNDWLAMVKFVCGHVEGPPRQELDVTSEGGRIGGVALTDDKRDALVNAILDRRREGSSRPNTDE